MLGVLGSAGAAICLAPYGSALAEWNLGQAINAVTELGFGCFLFSSWNGFDFCFVFRFTQLCAHSPQSLRAPTRLTGG
jgi:hypothetical protein